MTTYSPAEIHAAAWRDIARHLYESMQRDRLLLVAAGLTFYALLALFPATAAIVSLYGLFADASLINEHLRLASGFLPEGALSVVGDQVTRIAAQGRGTLGFVFFGTLALSLWGANAGTKAVFDALNLIYKEDEKRGFIELTLRSMVFTLGGIFLLLAAFAGVVGVPVALTMLGIPSRSGAALWSLLRWPALYLVILLGLACLYRFGPSRSNVQWRWISWGSVVAGSIWLLGSLAFSWYVANFGTYNATYGSLGAVIGFMIWLWLSMTVVLIGAEIDAELERRAARNAQ